MLESHNDVAVAIAEHVGGSVEGFATMMNDKARELNCMHTNFITPNGLDAVGHYTTANDLAVIASYAIKNEKFIEITNATTHEFKDLKQKRSFRVTNKDRFLYMMEGAIGIKTGFTNGAGYCFVGAIKRPDRTLISVVLGCGWPPSKNLKWTDTRKLMDYGLEHYQQKQIFKEVNLDPVMVNNGQQKYVSLKLEGNLVLLMRNDEKVRIEYDIPKVLQAPVKTGSIVGKAKYYINDTLYETLPIYAMQDIEKINLKYCFKKLLQFWSQQY
jgi:D-alanyl-D-alanine carboxypeptidase (penicillin-binding protein 5/6)